VDTRFEGLDADTLAMIIHDVLRRADLERTCAKLGLEWPGHRLSAIESVDLAYALADVVMNREDGHELVSDRIARALEPVCERLAALSPADVKARLPDLAKEFPPGALAVALEVDPRRAVRKLAKRVDDAADARSVPEEAPRAARVWVAAIARRADELEARVENLKQEIAARDEKLAAAHRQVERLQRELDGARAETERLQEAARAARTEDRDRRKMEHELAELRREAESLRRAGAERDAVMRDLERLRAQTAPPVEEPAVPAEEPEGVPEAVLAVTSGRRAIIVGGQGRRPEHERAFMAAFRFAELEWETTERGAGMAAWTRLAERMRPGRYDVVIFLAAYTGHGSNTVLQACKRAGIPVAYVTAGYSVNAIARAVEEQVARA